MYRKRSTYKNINSCRSFGGWAIKVSTILCLLSLCVQAGVLNSCNEDGDCIDQYACTTDHCINGFCVYNTIPGCVPCEPNYICPPIEIVFVMDTSGSMMDEAAVLCENIDQMVTDLSSDGIQVIPHILGITNDGGAAFPCITNHVVNLLGGQVPGDGLSCPFPESEYAYESWGPATAIVAQSYPWQQNAVRLIVPISDEGPCNGSRPNGCNDPGDDRDSIDNAINIALNHQVSVSPITGTGAIECVTSLAALLAGETGGINKTTVSAQNDFPDSVLQILLNHCEQDFTCNDLNECTDVDTCNDGICKGMNNYDDSFFCCNPENRVLKLLDDQTDCTDDLCDTLTGDVSHPQSADGTLCDDDNLCTDLDQCAVGLCRGTNNFDDIHFCCNPSDRTLSELEDGDLCTADLCDSETGIVSHEFSQAGTQCDDQDDCTAYDSCNHVGVCNGVDINTLPCNSDVDCASGTCNTERHECVCGSQTPELRIIAPPPHNPEDICYPVGDTLLFLVELGYSASKISGANLVLDYDPNVLQFLSISPGRNVDPESAFKLELYESVDQQNGTIIYSVGIQLGEYGVTGPATMAAIRFEIIEPCSSVSLCYTTVGSIKTVLSDDEGVSIPFVPICPGELKTGSDIPVINCPGSKVKNLNAQKDTSLVIWDPISVTSSCDETLIPECIATHSEGANIDHLIESGGEFPSGISHFDCTISDSCGHTVSCEWSVTVHPVNIVEVDIELSPIISDFHQPLKRCIEFHFIDICYHSTLTITKEIDFGLPYNFTGSANKVRLEIPAGYYQCVTARDPKHTIRSSSNLTVVNGNYRARFSGDPTLNGNWLRNGNLDGNSVIDIVDYSLMLSQAGVNVNPDTACGFEGTHADLNGDGLVNEIDQAMLTSNFLSADQPTCCSGGEGTTSSTPRTEISFHELEDMGIYGLDKYDTNGDGLLSLDDISRRTRPQTQIIKKNETSRKNNQQLNHSILRVRP